MALAPGYQSRIQVLGGAALLATAIRFTLEFAARVHLALGAVLAVGFAGLAVWLTLQVKRSPRSGDEVLGVLILGFLSLAVVCGWTSFTLHESGLGRSQTHS